MDRRRFVARLARRCAVPAFARAQPGSLPVVGFLRTRVGPGSRTSSTAFREGLAGTGFVEGATSSSTIAGLTTGWNACPRSPTP